jgi:putative ABC transport system substrate-binding protein
MVSPTCYQVLSRSLGATMRRREFIFLLGGAVAIPLAALAQDAERARLIGVLIGVDNNVEGQARLAAFRNGMHDLGWNE